MKFNRKQINYQTWLTHPNLDPESKRMLLNTADSELEKAFGDSELEFGTAGIRGIMGIGPNRFNRITIKKVTIAYAQYLINHYPKDLAKGVVVGHDSRHHSKEFAQLVAEILTSFSIPTYLFSHNEMIPTPVVSFATKKLKAIGGIVITASHNPAIYNGYKIYDSTGVQLADKNTQQIANNMKKIDDILSWKFVSKPNLIKRVPSTVLSSYHRMLKNLQFYPQETKSKHNLKIIYSGVNGTGNLFTPQILRQCGYQVIEVPQHQKIDPDFKNVRNPNPEFAPAWKFPLLHAKKNKADLIIMNDPDADRIGIAVNNGKNKFIRLNGNETGSLLIDWKLSQSTLHHQVPKNPVLYSSVVTSDLGDRIAKEKYNVTIVKTLTGFKWMGEAINEEYKHHLNFVFAYEESFGYLIDASTRDKDGIQAAVMISEMTWFYKIKSHQTLLNCLDGIYKNYGYYYTPTINYNVPIEAKDKIFAPLIQTLRTAKFKEIGGLKVIKIEDYLKPQNHFVPQNLLKFYFDDGSWMAVRPSGTEPKLKIYFMIRADNKHQSILKFRHLKNNLKRKLKIKI